MNHRSSVTRPFSRAACALTLFLLPHGSYAATPPPDPGRFEVEVTDILAREASAPPAQGGILFIGSSNIRKWPLKTGFPDLALINHGFGGSQTTDCTYFFDKLVTPFHPKLLVFHAGGNDLSAGRTPEEIAADVEAFIKKAHTDLPNTKVIYIGLFPAPSRWNLEDKYHQTTKLLKPFLKKEKVTFIDPEKPLLSSTGEIRPEIYEGDRLHLNPQGYEIMTKLIAPYIKRAAHP